MAKSEQLCNLELISVTNSVIVPSSPERGDFVSTISLHPKKDGTHRTILNLKQFNTFVEYHHFKNGHA